MHCNESMRHDYMGHHGNSTYVLLSSLERLVLTVDVQKAAGLVV